MGISCDGHRVPWGTHLRSYQHVHLLCVMVMAACVGLWSVVLASSFVISALLMILVV